jgi:hypothetical protein
MGQVSAWVRISWPEPRKRDPEGSIERGEPGRALLLGVDRELLSEGHLDHGLLLTAAEWGEQAVEKSDQEPDQHPHGTGILRDQAGRDESESTDRLAV